MLSENDRYELEKMLVRALKPMERNGEQQTEAFNRVAEALEALAGEIKGLRADLTPEMNKPKMAMPNPVARAPGLKEGA